MKQTGNYYQSKKTLTMNDGAVSFTKGKVYPEIDEPLMSTTKRYDKVPQVVLLNDSDRPHQVIVSRFKRL